MNIQTQLLNSVSELSAFNIPAYCIVEIGKGYPICCLSVAPLLRLAFCKGYWNLKAALSEEFQAHDSWKGFEAVC